MRNLIKLLLVGMLVGCTTVEKEVEEEVTVQEPDDYVEIPKAKEKGEYEVGDCLMIVDLPRGETNSPYRVRIEKIEGRVYWYRWLLDDDKWAYDLSCLRRGHDPCSEFESLEKISKKVDDCPK